MMLTAWFVLAAHVVGPKPASEALYEATECIRVERVWKDLPRLAWTGSRTTDASGCSVATSTGSTSTVGPDFYVNSQCAVLPATGCRYMESQYAAQTQSSMSAPLSYFGFTDYSTGAAARNGFQIFYEPGNPASWSDASLKGEFDTLQLFGPDGFVNAKVPLSNGGAGPGLEPYTRAYLQFGIGGQAQLLPVAAGTKVQLKNVTVIPSK